MADTPVLVRAYTVTTGSPLSRPLHPSGTPQALPPISSYAFADILRSADCPDFQDAIDGIAELCAKNRMSLADEYASHLPPFGEITASTAVVRSSGMVRRPGLRMRALTSVPEASSSSGSEGSGRIKKRRRIFSFGRKTEETQDVVVRRIRIGSMGRSVVAGSTIAMAESDSLFQPAFLTADDALPSTRPPPPRRVNSEAMASLQRLLCSTSHSRE
ncbi:hypothetical protein M433DRAFT_3024 [Acidomyces richmondensis BFW]|nr:MAG: hypothetical protein FE78DRAFT_77692 [Acidomyces sp. 'richmondensis']KYG47245.1 hypothetical protein M433DRAFT_3024 [Acidomyces richmondensis BFW]